VLDANAIFGTVVEAVRMRSRRPDATNVAPAIVVGIGYDTDGPYERARRSFDYTPTSAAATSDSESGGAAAFLAFIEEDVKPAIARDFAVDTARHAIYGHSLAGYFVLHALFTRPQAFRAYVSVSPSIWRDRDELFGRVPALESHLGERTAPLDVMMAVGEYEQALAPWQPATPQSAEIAARRSARRMVDDARDLSTAIARLTRPGVRVHFSEFAGEDHASVNLIAISQALRFVLAP
jgi:predicted alpha/beta superfamily hydrolase